MSTKRDAPPLFPQRRLSLLLAAGQDKLQKKKIDRELQEDLENLKKLRDSLGIANSPGWELILAWKLAQKLYPAVKPRAGRPNKWGELAPAALAVEHWRIMRDMGIKATEAYRLLAKQEICKSFVSQKNSGFSGLGPDPADTIRKIVVSAKKKNGKTKSAFEIALAAFRGYEHQGAIAEWDSYVASVVSKPHID